MAARKTVPTVFLRLLVSKSLKHFCFVLYQVFPGILTLKTNTLKLVNPVIAILILTIENWQTEKSASLYTNKQIIIQIRKYRRLKGRPQVIFITPKPFTICYILLSYGSNHSRNDHNGNLKNDKRHFSTKIS